MFPVDSPRFRGTVLLALLIGLGLRVLWPAADPPARLSWSSGILTDPPANTLAARNAALGGDWNVEDYSYRYAYPAMEGLTWGAYEVFGVSRRTTVLLAAALGALGLAVTAGSLLACSGWGAALAAILLGGFSYWHVMFSRVPLTENGVVLVLAASAGAALGRGARWRLAAGGLAGFAVLFGKYHAAGFLPALGLFFWLRERNFRALLAPAVGGGAVFLAWLFVLFLPHREEILSHVLRQSVGTHGTLPVLESPVQAILGIFQAIRQGWTLHQMPLIGGLGGFFAVWTLGNGRARRRRIESGTALFALWFVTMWLYYSLLPYRAPRYFVLLGLPLIACAASQIVEMLSATKVRLRRPRGVDEWVPLAIWSALFGYGLVDALNSYVVLAVESLKPGRDIASGLLGTLVDVNARLNTFEECLAWGAGVAAVLLLAALVLPRPAPWRHLPRLALFAVALSVAGNLAAFAWWGAHRSYVIEETQSALDHAIAENAVIFGNFGPLLAQNSRRLGIPYFESLEGRDLLTSHGVTHLAVELPRGLDEFRSRYPGLLERLELIQVWPFRTRFVQKVALFRLPADRLGDYAPTQFEKAVAEVRAGNHERARELLEGLRTQGAPVTPDLLSFEAICWSALGEDARAERLLREAIALRPYDSHLLLNMGLLAFRKGDEARAREIWTRGLRYDPYDKDLAARLETVPADVGSTR